MVLASGKAGSRSSRAAGGLPCWPRPQAGPPIISFSLTSSHPGPPAAKGTSFLMVPSPKSQNKLSLGHLESHGHSRPNPCGQRIEKADRADPGHVLSPEWCGSVPPDYVEIVGGRSCLWACCVEGPSVCWGGCGRRAGML